MLQIRFSLRNNDGVMVAKAPWKIQLGGGASVESPHYQRVHYCELLLGDFVQRLQVFYVTGGNIYMERVE